MTALVGALRVSLSADTANFEAGMKRAQRQTATTATSIQKSMNLAKTAVAGFVSGLSVGLFVNIIKAGLQYAASLGEVAQQLGVTTKQLQVYRFAAGQVGVSQEQLDKGLQKLTISLGQAKSGAEAPKRAFDALSKLIGKDIVESAQQGGDALPLIADGLAKVTDRSKRAAIEVAIFGRAGAQLDNLLSGGSTALDELSAAAEKLGIVLSDEQIQKADDTADKLDALKTVLSANIAGAVADNADSILALGNALATLVRWIAQSVQGWRILINELKSGAAAIPLLANPATTLLGAGLLDKQGLPPGAKVGSITVKLPPARSNAKPVTGSDIGKFLAPKGGGGKKARASRADHSAEDALRDSFQFDQELRRSQMDVLRAQQDLAADYIERTTIGIEILNAEKDAYEAELRYQTALFDLTKGKEGLSQAQAAQLKAANDQKDSLERQALLQEEQEQRQRDVQELTQHDFDRRREVLQAQDQIATTAAERRKIELELLEIAYQQKRQALEYTIATSKDIAAVEDARRDLLNLNKTHAADRQAVMQNTAGPLEQWKRTVPQTTAEINEYLQAIEVDGLNGISGAIAGIIAGTESMRDAFHSVAQQMVAEITAVIVKMLILKAIQAATGTGGGGFDTSIIAGNSAALGVPMPGMATGGFVSGPGSSTSDSVPAMLSNGEYVLNASAVRKFGVGFLDAMNEGQVPHMKKGGILGALKFISPVAMLQHFGALRYASPGAFVGNKLLGNSGGVSLDGKSDTPAFVFNNYAKMSPEQARQTGMQAAAAFNAEVARSRMKGMS